MRLHTVLLRSAALLSLAAGATAAHAERGADGHVNILYWQAPSIMNPYLSSGTKDLEASSLVLEPLARFAPDGKMIPFTAASIPTVENGGVSDDLTTITWKLKDGIKWSDGTPFTSADVVFTAKYCMAPDGGCAQFSKFDNVKSVEALDPLTVKVTFKSPQPNPYLPFMGNQSPIIQEKQFKDCVGAAASTCTQANFNPAGTGPFTVVDFKPNDVITMKANPYYRDAEKPAFATLTLKGGGDAAAAARAVLETGEYDYAWNLQLAPEVLAKMEKAGKGTVETAFGSMVERIEMNLTDPSPDLAPDVRATRKAPHPILSDERVRRALSMAIDRPTLVEIGYGDAGKPTCNLVPAPAAYADETNTGCLTQDIDGANKLLDEAGWKMGPNGVREKDGKELDLLFQTSTNAVRQNFQEAIKAWWSEIGVKTELRNINGSVYFGGDPGSPDTFQKFYADVEMYANEFDGNDPQAYLAMYRCGNEPKPSSQWQGENINRYCDANYDALLDKLAATGEIEKRGEIAKQLNDMLTRDSMTIVPLVDRGRVIAHSDTLGGVQVNAWDSGLWNAADWYRIKD